MNQIYNIILIPFGTYSFMLSYKMKVYLGHLEYPWRNITPYSVWSILYPV